MRGCLTSLVLGFSLLSAAQDSLVAVRQTIISGNKVTKDYVILREVPFSEGDSLSAARLPEILSRTRSLLLNTTLFKDVKVEASRVDSLTVDVLVILDERWYIFPIPVLELADRNFNVWWSDYDHDLRRLVYGCNFYHDNLTGRADRLRVIAQFGFNQVFGASYKLPYFNQTSRYGMVIGWDIERTRDVYYADSSNKQLFFRAEDIAWQRGRAYATVSRRHNYYIWHMLHASFHRNVIADTIGELNPNYFTAGLTQQYLATAIEFVADWRDFKAYPKHGEKVQLLLRKNGLLPSDDYNQIELRSWLELHRNPWPRLILSLVSAGKVSWTKEQPYYNYRGLGFGNTLVRGYERYVMSGRHFVILQSTAKFRFLSFFIAKPLINIKALNDIPLDFYIKPHFDVGYVWDPLFPDINPLNNALLTGAGIGLDIVTYYDQVMSFNFTFNGRGENGIYLHFNL